MCILSHNAFKEGRTSYDCMTPSLRSEAKVERSVANSVTDYNLYNLVVTRSEWEVTSNERSVTSGEWEVTSGERSVTSGEWEVTSGERSVTSGEWEVTNGERS
ncbi:tetratricopeptide repeat-containing protein [Plakobranchus ocellatus]|uniref:Tetratricopeptide repeat-containing protein n=1 Tax=Plakobranchus ocellatus TaxID=259542 RepID=A0AAV4B9F4_9GAST|nr:tetratricopeptide repeat-containing protein [Plakobranchus ocellatus]